MTYKIQVNKEVAEVYELDDARFEAIFTFDEHGDIDYREWSDCEIARVFKDHGKLVSRDWWHPDNPIEYNPK